MIGPFSQTDQEIRLCMFSSSLQWFFCWVTSSCIWPLDMGQWMVIQCCLSYVRKIRSYIFMKRGKHLPLPSISLVDPNMIGRFDFTINVCDEYIREKEHFRYCCFMVVINYPAFQFCELCHHLWKMKMSPWRCTESANKNIQHAYQLSFVQGIW